MASADSSLAGRHPWLLACTALSCTGTILDPSGRDDPAGLGQPDPRPAAASSSLPSPDTGLRRLTRTEYGNTIRDLLGATPSVGNALDPDAPFNGLDNNAQVLSLRVPAIDRYDDVASVAVDSAFGVAATRARLLAGCLSLATACASKVVSTFARRAWRRPVDSTEVAALMTALDDAKAQGDGIEDGMKLAFRMVLTSPYFLYRMEVEPLEPRSAGGLHRIGSHELATRMSYLIWASTPDDELLGAADATGDANLGREAVFTAQLGRMLSDKKGDSLVTNFAAQWLGTREAASVSPDPKIFPSFYQSQGEQSLRQGMAEETQAFFREFLNQDRDAVDMLDTSFTFVNDRLAKFYGLGLPSITGTQKVTLPAGAHRFGLLSQAGILLATSNPDRTLPSRRGKWVLTRLLCSPPPPPPDKVPPLPSDPTKVGLSANATLRERLEAHKTMGPACAACHALFDPLGLGLENYDGIGMWRNAYKGGIAIDASGALPDGSPFKGAQDLSRYLKNDPRFARCLANTMFAYALGRDPTAEGDRAAVDRLTADFFRRGGRIRELLTLIATSQAFQFRGGQ